MRETYGIRGGDQPRRFSATLLLSEQREFAESASSRGLQLADMLATILRRALNNRLQSQGWAHFGRLLIADNSTTPFVHLGTSDGREQTLRGQQIEKVCRALKSNNKQLLRY